jgi:cytidyltransferase-like protein
LYTTFKAVIEALDSLENVEYIVTGGSLLGAIRQHSILFCDDDIDIAIIERQGHEYEQVSSNLGRLLGNNYTFSRPWEAGDRVRPKNMNSVFVDIFVLRRFDRRSDLVDLLGMKQNGLPQSEEYVERILKKIEECAFAQGETCDLFPLWHFNARKAIEMWPKEVYREHELFPVSCELKLGPLIGIKGPRMPVLLLKRAFGLDCFEVYYQSTSHKSTLPVSASSIQPSNGEELKPLVLGGGNWEGGAKLSLEDEHYLPMMTTPRAERRLTDHGKERLFLYLEHQSRQEESWQRLAHEAIKASEEIHSLRPRRTVYMDGVFDLFHIGHLEAIRQCAELGNRVIIGVTGDSDATSYKRAPIISEIERSAIVGALQYVDEVVCPCPLIVTESFMRQHGIDLVVHGFADDADVERQREFFIHPLETDRFQRINYYRGQSTSDIINKIRRLPE